MAQQNLKNMQRSVAAIFFLSSPAICLTGSTIPFQGWMQERLRQLMQG
jgi:hypothetical protein